MSNPSSFVKTDTFLDKILAHKVEEVAQQARQRPLAEMRSRAAEQAPARDFAGALRRETVALIAEVKKASPSKGVLIEDFDPVQIATVYARHGAAAISVLTDEHFFQGSLQYLIQIREAVQVPLLCKEFILDYYQIYAARAAGADAVLLIVAALADAQLADLHRLILELGMTPLVEVHQEDELDRALKLGARVIGINNRDLKTFQVDLATTARLAKQVPEAVTLVAESGIMNAGDVRRMGQLGAHAVLVGESLVKSGDMAASVSAYSSQKREGAS
ncbi:MAG: indole-3-glycerol phosphate synthase TrpC [Anaerolineae bacterium]|nr:indole-3-glycerol phosphate synthase TrpC [Anaerolineae bacterium]